MDGTLTILGQNRPESNVNEASSLELEPQCQVQFSVIPKPPFLRGVLPCTEDTVSLF